MNKRMIRIAFASLAVALVCYDMALAQRGRGGGEGGGRSAGNRGGGGPGGPSRGGGAGPAMSRPAPGPGAGGAGNARPAPGNRPGGPGPGNAQNFQRPGGNRPAAPEGRPGANANERPNLPGTGNRPGAGNRPGTDNRPGAGNRPGADNRPNLPGSANRPGASDNRPNVGDRRPGGPTSSQLDDFLGNSKGPGRGDNNRIGNENRVGNTNNIGETNRINNRTDASRNINVGDVNIGNSVNYADNRQQWVDNRHVTGNQVRTNAGDRYYGAYASGAFRAGGVGGYPYFNRWNTGSDMYFAWRAPTYAAMGAFMGASLASAQPRYYGYGTGGNVYYENNTVYVDGQASGTPEQYAQQALDNVESAPPPEKIDQEEWMPLGVFAFTQEDMTDSNTMIEIAVSKSGILAGTYYNETTGTSRPLKGSVDLESQRAVMGFADGKNTNVALETGLYNLTQDEAPSLLHRGTDDSSPVLLVRLPPPADSDPKQ